MRPLLTLGSVLALLFVFAACHSSEENLCNDRCDCEGCSPHDHDVCLNNYDEDARRADFNACGDFYDAWIDCQKATWYCDRNFHFHTNCDPERSRLNNCIN